jgi:hypothetical protein
MPEMPDSGLLSAINDEGYRPVIVKKTLLAVIFLYFLSITAGIR